MTHGHSKFLGVALAAAALLLSVIAPAQTKRTIQVKLFNESLEVLRNHEVSVNGKDYVAVGNSGTAYIEMTDRELPINSVRVKSDQWETASWNLSKGQLEIILRPKKYQVVHLVVRDRQNNPVGNTNVTYYGKRSAAGKTNAEGRLDIPLSLDEADFTTSKFTVYDHTVDEVRTTDSETTLIVSRKPQETVAPVVAQVPKQEPALDLARLDSVKSLTMFYALFKNISLKDLSPQERQRVDAKFNELVAQAQDTLTTRPSPFIANISDTSLVLDDIRNLLGQARLDQQSLDEQREDFNNKIKLISEKLESGITNLDDATRQSLLAELNTLEQLLAENAGRFFQNQDDYRQIISTLRERFFNVEALETKLSESEAQRLEEQARFRERLFLISGITIILGLLIIMLITFSVKLRKQKVELVKANLEINRINENLESIVFQRTRSLEEANLELDTFLYRASHDLRSPLCSIRGLCNISEHMPHSEFVSRIEGCADDMDRLLKKLSLISEINKPSDYSAINVPELLQRVVNKFTTVITTEDIQVDIGCPQYLVFHSYPYIIEGLLTNVLENALFFTSIRDTQDRAVALMAEVQADTMVIKIKDNGVGIRPEIKGKLFGMFFKGHEKSKGSGLGLYIVQKSLNAVGGNITVESQDAGFTTFTIYLPLDFAGTSKKQVA